jgi:hypothetical protein
VLDGTTTTNPGCCQTHHYSVDGTYKVKLTVTTTDGRTASTSQDVLVTHDVTIVKLTVPQTAKVGQTRTITVGLTNSRYAETAQVQLLKSVNGGGWQQVGTLTQYVPVRGANRTTNFDFNYTFAPEDGQLGKVTFQAVATVQGARDAIQPTTPASRCRRRSISSHAPFGCRRGGPWNVSPAPNNNAYLSASWGRNLRAHAANVRSTEPRPPPP